MTVYSIGTTFGSLSFDSAYNMAEDGDVFKFERGYKIEKPIGFLFEKSIELVGNIGINSNGQRTFSNVLEGNFVIDDNVSIKISNFWINPVSTDYFIISARSGSTVLLDTIYVNDNSKESLAIINADSNNNISFRNVEVKKIGTTSYSKLASNSKLTVVESPRFNSRIYLENSKVLIEKSTLFSNCGDVVNAEDNSSVQIIESSITSDALEDDYPAIWIKNSELKTEKTRVIQNEATRAIFLDDNSKFISTNDYFSSVVLNNAILYASNTTCENSLIVFDNSFVKSKDKFICLGKLGIELLVNEDSTAIFENLEFKSEVMPEVSVEQNSIIFVKNIDVNLFDDIKVMTDENSRFLKEKLNASKNNGVINEEIDYLEVLDRLVGLHQVKSMVTKMVNQVQANKKRIEKGLKPMQQNFNSVFLGNPGTGKTTVARLLGKILFQNGILSGDDFIFIEVSEPDLISQNVGGTAIQTKSILEKARGGILFIDEAYTLFKKDGSNFGQEAINTIMKFMEDYRDDIMIIFAGYTKEMEEFFQSNPGLLSRVPNRFLFEDYTNDEIVQLGKEILRQDQFSLEDEEYYSRIVSKLYSSSLDKSNARWIRNFNEKLTKEQFDRVVRDNSDDVESILKIDIENVLNQNHQQNISDKEDALATLSNLIGISKVKRQVQEFLYQAEANAKKEEIGIKVQDFTLHSLFLGNPGTGKTTVARIIGKLLYQKGLITSNKFIEVSRSDLVAGYVGQTATKTRKVLEEALGGVLFIDEAYTLSNGGANDFGKEAIEEILKFMEDHRRDIVIIFAGYSKEMSDFLRLNSGLTSRIPTIFDFEDYTPEEIVKIGLLGLQQYEIDNEKYALIVKELYNVTNDKSNGRWIRNLNDKLLRIQSARLIETNENSFNVISNEDIEGLRI